MKKIIIILTIILQLNNQTSAQTNCNIDSKKGLFVELFGNKICKNETLRTNLENYIIRNGYEFILLYGLGGEIFTRKTLQTGELFAGAETNLRLFISNLKTRNSNIQIGAVDGSRFKENQVDHLSLFFNNVNNYNARVAVDSMDRSKCIDFIVLEDEFWSDQSTAYSEYTAFVQPIMDTMKLIAYPAVPVNWPSPQAAIYLDIIDDLVSINGGVISKQEVVNEIDDKMDKIILTTYITDAHLQDECVVGESNLDKLFMPTDIDHGHRLQLFAQNSKPTHILELFSSESSDPTLNPQYTFDFMGKYLWWNGIIPETVFHTGTVDDMKINFETNYNSLDPNYSDCNGAVTLPFCAPNTSICTCTDHSIQTNGNIIDGIVWFKYGTMPFKGDDIPLYVSAGMDINKFPFSTTRISLNDNFNDLNPIVDNDDNPVTISATSYNWYRNGALYGSTFPPNNSIDVPAPADGVTDTWTGELVSNFIKWSFMNHFLRDDINITGSIGICDHCTDPYGIFTNVTNPTCPSYNNGSLTAGVYYGTGLSYLWSNGATTQTISGLSPGSYSVTIFGNFGHG